MTTWMSTLVLIRAKTIKQLQETHQDSKEVRGSKIEK